MFTPGGIVSENDAPKGIVKLVALIVPIGTAPLCPCSCATDDVPTDASANANKHVKDGRRRLYGMDALHCRRGARSS
jgi:hypothetical protein